jgi:ketosteroid isomerase-like protein
MSQENIEIIRGMYREWNRGDMAALAEIFDAEAEVRPALSTFLASTVYRGHEGVAAWYEETHEPWAEMRAEPRRFLDADDRTVVVVGLRARVAGGEVDVDTEIAHVVTVRDGKIVRLDGYEEPETALAALGFSE